MESESHEVVMRQIKLSLARMSAENSKKGFYALAKTMAEMCALLNSPLATEMAVMEFLNVVEFLVKSWCNLISAMDSSDVKWKLSVASSCDLLVPRVILLMGLCHQLILSKVSLGDEFGLLIEESLRLLQEEMHCVRNPIKHLALQAAFYSQVCTLDQFQLISKDCLKFLTNFALVQFSNANALLVQHKRHLLIRQRVVFEDDPAYDRLVDEVVCQSIFLLARLSLTLEEYGGFVLPLLLRNIILCADSQLQERLLKQIITCFSVSNLQIPTLERVLLASFSDMHPQLNLSDLMVFLLRSFLDASDQSVGVVHFEELWNAIRSMKNGSEKIMACSSLLQFQLTRRPVSMERVVAVLEVLCENSTEDLSSISQMVVDGVPKGCLEKPLTILLKAKALSYDTACLAIERIEMIENSSLLVDLLECVQIGKVDLKKQSTWDQVVCRLSRFSDLIGRMKPFATLQVFDLLLDNLDFVSQCILIQQWLPQFYDQTEECAVALRGILKLISSWRIEPVLSYAEYQSRLLPCFEDLSLMDSSELKGLNSALKGDSSEVKGEEDLHSDSKLLQWYLHDSPCMLASDLLLQLNVPIGVFDAVVECLLVFEEQCTDSRTQIELIQRIISFLGKCELSVADASSLCMRIVGYRRRLLRASDSSLMISLLMKWILRGSDQTEKNFNPVVDVECAERLVEESCKLDGEFLLLAVRILEKYGPSAVMGNLIFGWIQRLDGSNDGNMVLVHEIWSRVGGLSRPVFEVSDVADGDSCEAMETQNVLDGSASYFETFCDPDALNGFQ